MLKTAQLVIIENQQVVVLPDEFRFEVDQVYVRRDEVTGDVILSARSRSSWTEFMALRARLGPAPNDFLADRQLGASMHEPFDE